jgi:hypothetical protein
MHVLACNLFRLSSLLAQLMSENEEISAKQKQGLWRWQMIPSDSPRQLADSWWRSLCRWRRGSEAKRGRRLRHQFRGWDMRVGGEVLCMPRKWPTYTHTRTRTCTHAHTHTYTHTRTHAYAHAHMHIHTHSHTHALMHTHMHTHIHTRTHMHARMHTCVYAHARTHARARTHTIPDHHMQAARSALYPVSRTPRTNPRENISSSSSDMCATDFLDDSNCRIENRWSDDFCAPLLWIHPWVSWNQSALHARQNPCT